MPIFYRGAGLGTYWHTNDARLSGFHPHNPGATAGLDQIMLHVARGTTTSPYISLTRSYGVAWAYAMHVGRMAPTSNTPAYVYELRIDKLPKRSTFQLLDPVAEVAKVVGNPLNQPAYYHDGTPDFLLSVVDPAMFPPSTQHFLQSPPGTGTTRMPNLSIELETLVRALRDAEILAAGNIPKSYVHERHPVW